MKSKHVVAVTEANRRAAEARRTLERVRSAGPTSEARALRALADAIEHRDRTLREAWMAGRRGE